MRAFRDETSDEGRTGRERRRGRRGWAGLAVVCLAAGLLLWVRIRLITDFPRMAIAEDASAPATAPEDASNRDASAVRKPD